MSITQRLTGIPQTFWDDPDAAISLTHPIPEWGWVLATLAAATGVWITYKGLDGSAPRRAALATTRALTLLLLLLLALGPRIERGRTQTERDRVVVLLDESRSMNTSDPTPQGGAEPRIDQLERERQRLNAPLLRSAQRSETDVLAFADTPRPIPNPDTPLTTRGDRTSLAAAIELAVARAGTQPLAAILVLSDGRADDALDPDTIELLRQSDIPVFTRAMGSPDEARDLAVAAIDAPRAVFIDDNVPIDVSISTRGYDPDEPVAVELIDDETGDVLARDRATPDPDDPSRRRATITTSLNTPGAKPLRVRVVTPQGRPDLIASNDERPLELSAIADPIRVLYIDGHPRWEYRYLKNLLVREPSIDATCTIIARDRRFIVEGNDTTARVPTTKEEWEPFDVVVLGDLAPELLSESQQRALLEHVNDRGCGVLFAAGPGAMPARWRNAPLAVLLPVSKDAPAPPLTTPGVVTLNDDAQRAGLLTTRPGEPAPRISDPTAGWSMLRWSTPIDQSALKPGASVLANLTSDTTDHGAIVTTMRYGAGLAGYVGTDEIWRWRYGRGEALPERFWLPLVRTLARGTIDRRSASARLSALPTSPAPGSRTTITLDLFDQSAIENTPETLTLEITSPTSREPTTIELRGSGDRRATLWSPRTLGTHELSVQHPALGDKPITTSVSVTRRDAESRDPSTDHDTLAQLAELTGGAVLSAQDLDTFDTRAPNRTRVTALDPEITPLWDTPLVLALLVTLLSIEWIGRRIMRLA